MTPAQILFALKALDLVVAGLQVAPVAIARYRAARGKLDRMVAEGRDPTAEETADIDAAIATLQSELHG